MIPPRMTAIEIVQKRRSSDLVELQESKHQHSKFMCSCGCTEAPKKYSDDGDEQFNDNQAPALYSCVVCTVLFMDPVAFTKANRTNLSLKPPNAN